MKKKVERRFYLREFKAISHAISTYEDFGLLIKHLVEGTTRTFGAKGASILLFDETEMQLFHLGSYGISDEYLNKGPIFVDDRYCAFHSGSPVIIEDMQHDLRVQYPEAAAKEGISEMLSVPIRSRSAILGVLRIYTSEPTELNEEDIDALCVLTEQLGLVIELNGLRNFLEQVRMSLANLPGRLLEGN